MVAASSPDLAARAFSRVENGPYNGAIEPTAMPTASRGAWYSCMRTEEPVHVIGNGEEDED